MKHKYWIYHKNVKCLYRQNFCCPELEQLQFGLFNYKPQKPTSGTGVRISFMQEPFIFKSLARHLFSFKQTDRYKVASTRAFYKALWLSDQDSTRTS